MVTVTGAAGGLVVGVGGTGGCTGTGGLGGWFLPTLVWGAELVALCGCWGASSPEWYSSDESSGALSFPLGAVMLCVGGPSIH